MGIDFCSNGKPSEDGDGVVFVFKFRRQIYHASSADISLIFSENCVIPVSAILSQYTRVTDDSRQMLQYMPIYIYVIGSNTAVRWIKRVTKSHRRRWHWRAEMRKRVG